MKKGLDKKALAAGLKRLEAEAKRSGRTQPEQLSFYSRRKKNTESGQPKSPIPPKILRQLVFAAAGKSKRTPQQHLKAALHLREEKTAPKDLQNWYAQIYGEFANGSLSDVMREVLLYAANRGDELPRHLRAAILAGDLRYFEQITRCVALVHGLKHEGNGQASRLANLTQRNIGLAYLRLYELENKPPTARDIQVLLAHEACYKLRVSRIPKFSDLWYLIRSGPVDDSADKATRSVRYEVTGTKNIKKVIGSFKWSLGRSFDGPLSVGVVKKILDRLQLRYIDDSKVITGN